MTNSNLLWEIEAVRPGGDVGEPSAAEKLILKHAMGSFGRRGYAATTLRSIAAEANVTAPMVSYYFKSKEGLFLRVAEIVMTSLETEVARALETPLPFYDAIEAIARAHVELIERSPAALEFMLALLYGPLEGQPSPDLIKMYAGTEEMIRQTFERGIEGGEFRPRTGVTTTFLVEQFGSVIHEYAGRRFRVERLVERHPERRAEIEAVMSEMSLEVALDHFFFGAGELAGRERP